MTRAEREYDWEEDEFQGEGDPDGMQPAETTVTLTHAADPPPAAAQRTEKGLHLTRESVRQGIIFSELLGAPRARRPWRPNNARRS